MLSRFTTKVYGNFNRQMAINPTVPRNSQMRFFTNPLNPPAEKVSEDEKIQKIEKRDQVFTEKKLTAKDHLKVIWHHLKKGLIEVGRDSKVLLAITRKNGYREKAYSLKEMRERRRISNDLLKFIPYSIFLTVPFAELLLPIYLVLFPNSVPTQFLLESQIGKKTSELVEAQEDSYKNMRLALTRFSNVIGLDPIKFVQSMDDLLEREGRDKDRLFYKISDFESKLQTYLEKAIRRDHPMNRSLMLENMSSSELEQVAKLLCLDLIPGCNILNNMIFTFTRLPFIVTNWIRSKRKRAPIDFSRFAFYRYQLAFDAFPFSVLKKSLLLTQIKLHLKQIKAQDRCLAKDIGQLDDLSTAELASMARQRGIMLERSDEIKQYLVKNWLPLSVEADLSGDQLVWISFMRFSYCEIMV